MYRERYLRALLSLALMDMAEELALKAWDEPNSLINEYLLQAALVIEEQGLEQAIKNIRACEPKLYEQIFEAEKTNNLEAN